MAPGILLALFLANSRAMKSWRQLGQQIYNIRVNDVEVKCPHTPKYCGEKVKCKTKPYCTYETDQQDVLVTQESSPGSSGCCHQKYKSQQNEAPLKSETKQFVYNNQGSCKEKPNVVENDFDSFRQVSFYEENIHNVSEVSNSVTDMHHHKINRIE